MTTGNGHHRIDKDAVKAAVNWRQAIIALGGVSAEVYDRRDEGPCPKCAGSTRFRFFHDNTGGCYCSHCHFENNGDGFATLMWLRNESFPETLKAVAAHCGIEPEVNRATRPLDIMQRVAMQKSITVEAITAYGGKPATRNNRPCVRFPMYGPDGKQCSHFDVWDSDENGKSASKAEAKKRYASKYAGMPGVMLPHNQDGTPRLPQPGEEWCSAEGPKDACAAFGLGCPCIGLPTCKLPNAFSRMADGVHLVHVADRDEAGDRGAKRTGALLYKQVASYKVAVLPAEWRESKGADLRDVLKAEGEDVREFLNEHGERWRLEIDTATETATLSGDELADEVLEIADDEILADLILASDEAKWLDATWHEVFGRPFQFSMFNRLVALADPTVLHEVLDME